VGGLSSIDFIYFWGSNNMQQSCDRQGGGSGGGGPRSAPIGVAMRNKQLKSLRVFFEQTCLAKTAHTAGSQLSKAAFSSSWRHPSLCGEFPGPSSLNPHRA
jgi:hypothetical protein